MRRCELTTYDTMHTLSLSSVHDTTHPSYNVMSCTQAKLKKKQEEGETSTPIPVTEEDEEAFEDEKIRRDSKYRECIINSGVPGGIATWKTWAKSARTQWWKDKKAEDKKRKHEASSHHGATKKTRG